VLANRLTEVERNAFSKQTVGQLEARHQLRRAGLNVDLQEMEFGTVVKRRTSQSAPEDVGGGSP
jgi:hypothetical protein